jgi:hypothetical protein
MHAQYSLLVGGERRNTHEHGGVLRIMTYADEDTAAVYDCYDDDDDDLQEGIHSNL